MAKKLGTKERKKLTKKDFGLPGKRKYPIPDKAHPRNALAHVRAERHPGRAEEGRGSGEKAFPEHWKEEEKEEVATAVCRLRDDHGLRCQPCAFPPRAISWVGLSSLQ